MATGATTTKTTTITVKVLDTNVQFTRPPQTGLSIKEAAIRAGAAIQLDWVLSEVLPNGEQKIIPDVRRVGVHDGMCFWAIPGDDNS